MYIAARRIGHCTGYTKEMSYLDELYRVAGFPRRPSLWEAHTMQRALRILHSQICAFNAATAKAFTTNFEGLCVVTGFGLHCVDGGHVCKNKTNNLERVSCPRIKDNSNDFLGEPKHYVELEFKSSVRPWFDIIRSRRPMQFGTTLGNIYRMCLDHFRCRNHNFPMAQMKGNRRAIEFSNPVCVLELFSITCKRK